MHSQTKVPQKRLRFDDYDIKEPCPGLANGHSTEKGLEARVNETKGEAREHETEEGNSSWHTMIRKIGQDIKPFHPDHKNCKIGAPPLINAFHPKNEQTLLLNARYTALLS